MEKLDVRAFQRFNIDIQSFPFENFGGGSLWQVGGRGGNIHRFLVGRKHNFTNLRGENTYDLF